MSLHVTVIVEVSSKDVEPACPFAAISKTGINPIRQRRAKFISNLRSRWRSSHAQQARLQFSTPSSELCVCLAEAELAKLTGEMALQLMRAS